MVAQLTTGGTEACEEAQKACLETAKKNAKNSDEWRKISECEHLQLCEEVCGMVKVEGLLDCKTEKSACNDDCKTKHETGSPEYRECERRVQQSCHIKRICKKEAETKPDRTECDARCRDGWLTTECKSARETVMASLLKKDDSCASLAPCINA